MDLMSTAQMLGSFGEFAGAIAVSSLLSKKTPRFCPYLGKMKQETNSIISVYALPTF